MFPPLKKSTIEPKGTIWCKYGPNLRKSWRPQPWQLTRPAQTVCVCARFRVQRRQCKAPGGRLRSSSRCDGQNKPRQESDEERSRVVSHVMFHQDQDYFSVYTVLFVRFFLGGGGCETPCKIWAFAHDGSGNPTRVHAWRSYSSRLQAEVSPHNKTQKKTRVSKSFFTPMDSTHTPN